MCCVRGIVGTSGGESAGFCWQDGQGRGNNRTYQYTFARGDESRDALDGMQHGSKWDAVDRCSPLSPPLPPSSPLSCLLPYQVPCWLHCPVCCSANPHFDPELCRPAFKTRGSHWQSGLVHNEQYKVVPYKLTPGIQLPSYWPLMNHNQIKAICIVDF